MAKLIVNYIPQEMNCNQLLSIFATVGSVKSCNIMRDHITGYSYGYGFVSYRNPADAEKAILQLNGCQVGNKRIKVSYSRPPGEEIQKTNLYITNLPRQYTDDDLENMFGRFGRIVQKNLLKNKVTGMSRGVAFVRFDKRDEAFRAIAEMDGVVLEGGAAALSVKVAEDFGKQKAAYYIGWHDGLRHCNASFPPGLYGSRPDITPPSLGRSNIRAGKQSFKHMTKHNTSSSYHPYQNNRSDKKPANVCSPSTFSARVNTTANICSFPYQGYPPHMVQYPLPNRPTFNWNTSPIVATSQFNHNPANIRSSNVRYQL